MSKSCKVCYGSYESSDIRQRVCPNCLKFSKYCKCGCGRLIQKWKSYNGQERECAHGHNKPRKGIPFSDEAKIKMSITKGGWIPEKTELLKKHYPTKTRRELREILPDFTPGAIAVKANKLGLHKTPDTLERQWRQVGDDRFGSDNPGWKNGRWSYGGSPYGANWWKQRIKAKRRDDYTCQRCGKIFHHRSPRLHAHHKIPFSKFNFIPGENENYISANTLDNLISLCKDCHLAIEAGESL